MENKLNIFCNLFIILLLISSVSILLSCKSKEIKPKPSKGNWKICHACKGTGTIEVYVVNERNLKETEEDDDEELIGCVGGCMYDIFFSGTKAGEKYEEQLEEEKLKGNEEGPYVDRRPMKTKTIKCGLCNGLGWIPVSDLH